MPSLAMTLPLARFSPVWVPRRDIVAPVLDTLVLSFTLVEADDPEALPVNLTGCTVTLDVRGRRTGWYNGWGWGWDYGAPLASDRPLWTGDATIAVPLTGVATFVVPPVTVALWPRRCGFSVRLTDADGGMSTVVAGVLELSRSGFPAR
jgi:hypothetical protein